MSWWWLSICSSCTSFTKSTTSYYWDFANYWDKYRILGQLLAASPTNTIRAVIESIRSTDYNFLAMVPLLPFRAALGGERMPYILALANTYAITAACLSVLVPRAALRQRGIEQVAVAGYVIPIATTILLPQFWSPLLYGYPDVVGVCLINAILVVHLWALAGHYGSPRMIAMGLMLAGLILLRRWYAYWVVAFFVAAAAERILFMLGDVRGRYPDCSAVCVICWLLAWYRSQRTSPRRHRWHGR